MNPKDALRCGVAVASVLGSVIPAVMTILEPGGSGAPGFDWLRFAGIYGICLIPSTVALQVIAQFLPGVVVEITRRIRRRYSLLMAMTGCFLGFSGGSILFLTVRFSALSHRHWDDPRVWKCFVLLAISGASYGTLMALGTSLYIGWQKTHSSPAP